jgi:hypothetical protein
MLPLVRIEDGLFAAVLDCRESDSFRRATSLEEVRRGVYRRVRCAEELMRMAPRETIPAPETIHIERAISHTLGRYRPKDKAYSFRVHLDAELLKSFYVRQHHSPDNRSRWSSSGPDYSVLDVEATEVYSGLLFESMKRDTHFVLALGVHNWNVWSALSNIGPRETFERIVDEYYYFSKPHDRSRKGCRCAVPWKFQKQDTISIPHGISVQVDVQTSVSEREYDVHIRMEDEVMERSKKLESQSIGVGMRASDQS